MTLIAYKDGVLCADSLRTQSELRAARPVVKLARRNDGAMFASAGWASVNQAWAAWFLNGSLGEPPWRDTTDNFDPILVVYPDGSADYWATTALPERINGNLPFAIGHSSYLLGLMDAGLSAAEAVKIGARRYTGADYPLMELRHSGEPIIWLNETERGDPAQFFKDCAVDRERFIQDQPAKLAAVNT